MEWCRLRGNKHFKTESCGAVSLDLRERKRGVRSKKPLDVKSSARRVVPAYKDPDVLEDSSTTHRESMNIFNGFQCQQRTRALGSHDSGYASHFLQRWEPAERDLYCWPSKNGPNLAGVSTGSALLILKGVFGLNGALRMWWTKASRVLVEIRFRKQRMCRGLFALHDPSGFLRGLICLRVDDMLGTGDSLFDVKMEEVNKICRRSSITAHVSTRNTPKERWKLLDDMLTSCH